MVSAVLCLLGQTGQPSSESVLLLVKLMSLSSSNPNEQAWAAGALQCLADGPDAAISWKVSSRPQWRLCSPAMCKREPKEQSCWQRQWMHSSQQQDPAARNMLYGWPMHKAGVLQLTMPAQVPQHRMHLEQRQCA